MTWRRAYWLLAWVSAGCAPVSDIVAHWRDGDAGATCAAADSCTLPACANTARCQQPDAGVECGAYACSAAADRQAFCDSDGAALAIGDTCDSVTGRQHFRYAVCAHEDITTTAPLTIDGDVAVDGDESANFGAATVIRGTLYYSGKLPRASPGTNPEIAASVESEPRCGTDSATLLNLERTVRAHATDNDNTRVASTLSGIEHFSAPLTATLPCGRYYLAGIQGEGALVLRVTGHVALYIDGSVQLPQGLRIEAPAPARVTLVVNGAFHITGGFTLGEAATTTARHVLAVNSQVYLDGGESLLDGALYAPQTELLSTAPLEIRGAAYVDRARLNNATAIRYAANAAAAARCD